MSRWYRLPLAAATLLCLALALAGCGSSTTTTTAAAAETTTTAAAASTTVTTIGSTTTDSAATSTSMEQTLSIPALPEGAAMQVVSTAGSTAFTLDQLKQLPTAEITVEAKTEDGPLLSEVLKAAGVTDYTSVEVVGQDQSVVLTKAEVTSEVILDFTNKGSVKFASTQVAKDKWPHEVTLVTAQ